VTPPAATPVAPDYRLLRFASYMALFCVGLYASTFGPALPFIADDLGVSLDTAGLLLTAFFLGSIILSASVATLFHGHDTRALTIVGLTCSTAGLLGLGFAPAWQLAIAGAIVMGVGDGLMVAATHIIMTETSDDVAGGINTLNLSFAVGAVIGPIWSGAVLQTTGERSIAYAGIAVMALVTLAVMLVAEAAVRHPMRAPDEGFTLPGETLVWVMGLVLFFYVGAEFGLGSWVSSYSREAAGTSVFEGALLTSGYWFALMLGRVASGVYFARGRDPNALLVASIAGAGVASLVLALSSGTIVIGAIAAFGAGLFLGPIWPTVIAIASEGGAAKSTAATVAMGNAGGLAIPWLQGKVLVDAGPGAGVGVTAVLCLAMFLIVAGARLRGRAAVV
jgi:fucose permease